MKKLLLCFLVCSLLFASTAFSMSERFRGMGMNPLNLLMPDAEDVYYVTTMSQGGLVLGYRYVNGKHLGLGGLNLGLFNLTGGVSLDATNTLYTLGFGLSLGRLGVGIDVASVSFETGRVSLDGGIASKELFVLGKISFSDVALNPEVVFDEIKSKFEAGEYRLDVTARLHLGETLLLSGNYSEDKVAGEKTTSALVGLTLPVNHAYEEPVSRYYSRTKYQKLPTMIAAVYERVEDPDITERIGVVAEGIVRPAIVLRAGIFATKNGGDFSGYETFLGAGLVFSNLRVDVDLTGFSGFDSLGVEITLDGRKF